MGLDGVIKKFESDKFYYSDYEFVTNSHLGTIKRDIRTYKFLRDNPNDRVEIRLQEPLKCSESLKQIIQMLLPYF